MIELEKIPHIHEISNHGPYHGAREKNTATFQARSTRQNKLVPSLEEAIRRTGLKDGMTISFHHHFRNGDHIINTVVDKLAEMGFKNLTLAASSLADCGRRYPATAGWPCRYRVARDSRDTRGRWGGERCAAA